MGIRLSSTLSTLQLFTKAKKILLTLALLSATALASAESVTGRIVGVTDGDTVTLLDITKTQYKIRLAAIDAPEKAQPFGNRSKQALSSLCFNQQADVEVTDTDRYGRLVGIVTCNNINANEVMLSSGMAWVYSKYAKGFGHYYALEREAQAARIGLWVDNNPIPPWEWRKAKRTKINKQ